MLALSALVFSCKKDDKKSSSDQIIGKWTLVSHYENQFYSNAPHRDTTLYPSGYETIEFKTDGKLYIQGIDMNGPYKDTTAYKVDGSNLILQGQDTLKISNISGADLQLYVKYQYAADEYDELWANYKK